MALAQIVAQNMGFEAAPFKLTGEWVELMGGIGSPWFRYYRTLVVRGFQEARRHRDKLLLIAQATYKGVGGSFPCFRAGDHTLDALRQRFQPDMTPQQYARFASNLIDNSLDNWRTGAYDCVSDHALAHLPPCMCERSCAPSLLTVFALCHVFCCSTRDAALASCERAGSAAAWNASSWV